MVDLYLDHVLIAVWDLSEAARTFGDRLGFTVTPEGVHPGRGTSNRLIVFDSEYLELIAISNPTEVAADRPTMSEFLEAREGLYMFALGTPAIDETVAFLRGRRASIADPISGARGEAGKGGYTWRYTFLEPGSTPGCNTFVIQHDSTIEERYRQPPNPTHHSNGMAGIDHLSIAVRDADAAAHEWQRLFGLEEEPAGEPPPPYSHCASLQLGNCLLHFVSPRGESPLSRFIDQHGEAPYSLCLKARDVRATEARLASQGTAVGRPDGSGRADRRFIQDDPHGVPLHFVGMKH